MSATGATRSSITPDFVYILQVREYQHVLRPENQKSADFVVLVKTVVDDIEAVKILFSERGSFLVEEKQQIMRDVIDDTEDAIERVIRLLKPARIAQVSEESIRVNTKNPYILQSDDPKSGATFGRLKIANNRLGTVLHDLRNIEATAQLDTCEIRATTSVRVPPSRPEDLLTQKVSAMDFNPIHGHHETIQAQRTKEFVQSLRANPPQDGMMDMREGYSQGVSDTYLQIQSDPKSLLQWKRSRRSSRNTNSSAASSVSGTNTDEQDTPDARTPLSIQESALMPDSLDLSPKALRNLGPNGHGIQQTELAAEGRLPVIHELEGTSVSIKPTPRNAGEKQANSDESGGLRSFSSEGRPQSKVDMRHDQANIAKRQSSGLVMDQQQPDELPSLSEQGNEQGFARTTFSSYKRRNREKSRGESSISTGQTTNGSHTSNFQVQSNVDPVQVSQMTQNGVPRLETDLPHTLVPGQASTPQHRQTTSPPRAEESSIKFASRMGPERQRPESAVSSKVLTPSSLSESPYIRTSTSPGYRAQDTPSLYIESSDSPNGTHKIESGMSRVPTLLRAGEKNEETTSSFASRPPYPMSDRGSDNEEGDRLMDLRAPQRPRNVDRSATVPPANIGVRHVASAMSTLSSSNESSLGQIERSITVPLDSHRPLHTNHIPFPSIELRERLHQRSQSSAIPSSGLVRAPTVPRKPVPYQALNPSDFRAEDKTASVLLHENRAAKSRPVSEIFPLSRAGQGIVTNSQRALVDERPLVIATEFQQMKSPASGEPVEQLPVPKSMSRQEDDYEDAQSHISSRMSSISSRGLFKSGDRPQLQSPRQKGIIENPSELNGTHTHFVESVAELPLNPMSPALAESMPMTNLESIRHEAMVRPERTQIQHPLRMHPSNGPPKTAYQIQSIVASPKGSSLTTEETHEKLAAPPRSTGDTAPTANLTFVPAAPILLNVNGPGHHERSRHPSRSHTTPEPQSQPENDAQMLLNAPRRASAQGSSEYVVGRPTLDPRSNSDVVSHNRTASEPFNIVSEPQMAHRPHLAASRLTHSLSDDGRARPGHEPSAFQAQNQFNGTQTTSIPQPGLRAWQEESMKPVPSREHILPSMLPQSPPQQGLGGEIPSGYFPDQRMPSQHQQSQYILPLPWQSMSPPSEMPLIKFDHSPQPLSMMSGQSHSSQTAPGAFPGSMPQYSDLPPVVQPHHQIYFQQYPQYQVPLQYQGQPHPHPQPLPSPLLPFQPQSSMPVMQSVPQPWTAPALLPSNNQFTPSGSYQQAFTHHPIPPPQMLQAKPLPPLGAQGGYSLQQISPVQPPSQLVKPPENLVIQQSPPPVPPRPMSLTSTNSQDKYNNGETALPQLQSAGIIQSAPQTRPITPISNVAFNGSFHKPNPSITSTTSFAAGLSSPSVPSLNYMPGNKSAMQSQNKANRSTFLQHQISRMKM